VAHPDGRELADIGRHNDEGKVKPHVTASYPLDHVAESQKLLEREHPHGKVVLQVA
jgi:NADPH:quinone reductase-like Zn-dependent oxidoreductase